MQISNADIARHTLDKVCVTSRLIMSFQTPFISNLFWQLKLPLTLYLHTTYRKMLCWQSIMYILAQESNIWNQVTIECDVPKLALMSVFLICFPQCKPKIYVDFFCKATHSSNLCINSMHWHTRSDYRHPLLLAFKSRLCVIAYQCWCWLAETECYLKNWTTWQQNNAWLGLHFLQPSWFHKPYHKCDQLYETPMPPYGFMWILVIFYVCFLNTLRAYSHFIKMNSRGIYLRTISQAMPRIPITLW